MRQTYFKTIMTEQEAEAWAARLTRIWKPEKIEVEYGSHPDCFFDYIADITASITLEVDHDFGDIHFYLNFDIPYSGLYLSASMSEGMRNSCKDANRKLFEARKPLVDEWLPVFRRNCWLSGLPIEATTHEKTEWLQGFYQEEIEAWNLKF